MSKYLDDRALKCANYLINNKTTVRKVAQHYGLSKSTVHNDIAKRLRFVNYNLYLKVKKILEENFSNKHIRGGEATKHKYLKLKQKQKISAKSTKKQHYY